ncbi:uncharacterized protein BCR38DRAFT_484196 [Pseudomassariella vexata]|uniref:Major facilitator superfamily (MFS) profile domain-containing protein n=1 Tax=Pseudomassariella vexata TaxID=1141098 RepID=A0A1Y2E4X3_9PEZI|nr:uncharacterized protein BCR38DRAFT_484196 [Pseudomassariella vexata]ORY66579.1 hypothetical protein BCR38DRAFT_484196 [Pseudomassariella vexata]
MGKRGSFRRYTKACLWWLFCIWYVLLVSFENQASGNILGIPRFHQDFGHLYDGSAIIGCLGGSALADLLGRKPVLIGVLVLSYAAITMQFIATTKPVFFGGKFLKGFATGTIATVLHSHKPIPLPTRD